jgi:hypothetical protein
VDTSNRMASKFASEQFVVFIIQVFGGRMLQDA